MTDDHAYEAGLRDGKIASLELTVRQLTTDVDGLKKAIYLLYGAIAIVQFAWPVIERALGG